MLKAIIIDDEERARSVLQSLLDEYCPEVEVLATAASVPEGVRVIQDHQPELVFLDIEMPGYSGFQLLDFFPADQFAIVFTTAYKEYAVQAFEVSAVDYLLKPIVIDKLIAAVQKVHQTRKTAQETTPLEVLKENFRANRVERIALPVTEGILFVESEEISHLEAEGAYTQVYLANGSKVLVSKHLKQLESLLDHPTFFRTHRSHLINLNRVRRFIRREGGYIEMDDGSTVPLAKNRKEDFLQAFERG